MKYRMALSLCAALVVAAVATSARAEGWGNLKGKFVFDGTPPKPEPLLITADKEYCSKHAPVDQSLVVGKDGGLANVVVYLYTKPGETVPIYEDYEDIKDEPVVLDNSKCAFEPHVATMWVKQPLVIKNSDEVAHNSKVDLFVNAAFNLQIPAGAKIEKTLEDAERLPSKVSCGAHPWMTSILVVRPNPYVTKTDAAGNFEIKDLPAGEWEFQFWHEKWGYVKTVHIDGKKVDWTRGRTGLKIAADKDTDLGTVKVNPEDYKK